MKTIALGIKNMLCVIAFIAFYACTSDKSALFYADYATDNDTIMIECWKNGHLNRDNTSKPFITSAGEKYVRIGFFAYDDDVDMFSEENAFHYMCIAFDSVKFTRLSDNAQTLTYRHDEDASETQLLFFKKDAWERQESGDFFYTFHLSDDMFH